MVSILSVLFIFTTTLFTWKGVLSQALIGEGSIYFVEPYLSMVQKEGISGLWARHDVQALLFFHYIRDIFYDNMNLYMFVLICGAFLVALTVYLIIKNITKSQVFGIIGSILVIANFIGSFEILGLGYYQWFIQRVPNFALALLGFLFLIKFIEKKKIRYYMFSLTLYLLAVFLARYTIHILPLFIFYLILNKNKMSQKLTLSLPFILGSYFLMIAQTLVSGGGIFDFIFDFSMIPKVFYQVTFLTFPFLSLIPRHSLSSVVHVATPFITLAYGAIFFTVIKKHKKLTPIISSIFFSIFLSVYLSFFLNPYFADFFESSRYLYYTSILISLFWTISIHSLTKKKPFVKIFFVLFITGWFIFNKFQIDKNFASWQERHDPVVMTIKYVSLNKDNFKNGSFIVVSKQLGFYTTGMLDYLYKYKNFDFEPNLDEVQKPVGYVELKYDLEFKNITRIDH